ncbi:hypothetical protein QJS10_CPA03g01625 [Acorus calamus]|uniref:Reverse transcriptase zinc-binding domain-containing protein n=1 Tax=Acorus calamus TaxID=4465 RepID=A0AAV9F9J9_ACOCL|nr:hypothetical protein QJS10_CPA03g01625 [Acorus calamus]
MECTQFRGAVDPLLPIKHFIKDGKWVQPPWWSADWDDIWGDISDQECGGFGDDTLIWPLSRDGMLRTPQAWTFLRAKKEKPKWSKWLWQKFQPQKFSMCTWLALLGRVGLNDLGNLEGKVLSNLPRQRDS